LRHVASALPLGDAEQLGEHTVLVAGAEVGGGGADTRAALGPGAALLGLGALEVVAARGPAALGLLARAAAGPLELLARGAADPVLLAALDEAAVQGWTLGLTGTVPAEEGPGRVGDLQGFARGADVRQGLGLAAAWDRRAGRTGAGHVDELAGLAGTATHTPAGVATLAARASVLRLDLQPVSGLRVWARLCACASLRQEADDNYSVEEADS
jgi:hypothetical protein